MQIYFSVNTECTVLELMLCRVLVSKEIEAHNHIELLLFIAEWPHWLLKSEGFTFYIKTCNAI